MFYCGMPEEEAACKLLTQLKALLDIPDADEDRLVEKLCAVFEENGYHALFGDTQGYYGPYIWRETVPTVYNVELPGGTAEYTVNILKGFVFRSWMDYLTFGQFGTGGWASKDGTINCVEKAYDFESDRFQISFLKHARIIEGITSTAKQAKKIAAALNNNYTDYYHWLPRNTLFVGGYINFRKVITYSPEELLEKFHHPLIKVQEGFVKSILSRFSTYYARQGQPDFNFDKEANDIVQRLPVTVTV